MVFLQMVFLQRVFLQRVFLQRVFLSIDRGFLADRSGFIADRSQLPYDSIVVSDGSFADRSQFLRTLIAYYRSYACTMDLFNIPNSCTRRTSTFRCIMYRRCVVSLCRSVASFRCITFLYQIDHLIDDPDDSLFRETIKAINQTLMSERMTGGCGDAETKSRGRRITIVVREEKRRTTSRDRSRNDWSTRHPLTRYLTCTNQ